MMGFNTTYLSVDCVLVEMSVKKEFADELCKAMDKMYPVSIIIFQHQWRPW